MDARRLRGLADRLRSRLIAPGDGDGETALAVWNSNTAIFTVLRSRNGQPMNFAWVERPATIRWPISG